jgi:hypothetical protein
MLERASMEPKVTPEELAAATAWIQNDPGARNAVRSFAACERAILLTHRSRALTRESAEARKQAGVLRDQGRLRRLLR